MSTVSNVQSRIAGLADNSQVISGVAIGIGDITKGLEGERKYWPREELRAAAASLEGQEINALHSQQTVGEVTRAGFDPNRGVIYEAELKDAKLAENIGRGGFEVSIEAEHADGGTVDTDRGEAMLCSNIQFTGMAIVQHGAAPSASAQPGEAAALSPADIGERLDRAALAEVNGTEVDLTPPESVVTAVEAAQDAKAEYDGLADCGTGVGDTRGEQIVSGDLAPADFTTGGQAETAIHDYLNSHEGDVDGIDEPPTEWDEETWTDGCGPVQYALWGGTATGEGLEWAQSTAAAIEAAMEESEAAEPTYEAGDRISWTWGDGRGYGRVADVFADEGSVERTINGNTVRRDSDDEPVYLVEVWRDGAYSGEALKYGRNLRKWGSPPKEARAAEMADVPDEYVFDNPGEAVEKAQDMGLEGAGDELIHTRGEGDETVFMPAPSHDELLEMLEGMGGDESAEAGAAAGTDDSVSPETGQDEGRQDSAQPDDTTTMGDNTPDPQQRVNELKAELSDVREERDELAAQVEQYEQKEEAYEAAAEEFATALADSGETLLDEAELVDRFSVAELAAKVDETEEATLADTEPDVQSGGGESSEEATLSDSEREAVAEHREVIAELAGKDGVFKHERQRRADLVADITGEDPDTILDEEA